MLKPVIAATAILAIAGSSIVYAQQRYGGHDGFGHGARTEQHHRLNADEVSAMADARIAALKAGLELTPDQAKNWPAFEAALRNMVQLRVQRIQARQAASQQTQTTPATPFDRMEHRADTMAKRGAALKQIADAGGPLYASLNDAQKTRFHTLGRMLRPHQHANTTGGNVREGRGYGRDGRGQDGRSQDGHGRRFGQNGQDGQNGQGWEHGRRFGQNDQDGQGWGHRHGQNGRGPGMHNLSGTDTDQDSQL
jgi:hypothetical protein